MPLDAQPPVRLERADTGPFHTRNASPCGRYWAVVHTHPQAERWACSNLTRRGYETFLPLCTVRRRDRAIRSHFHTVQVPAFPRYAFVSIDTGWAPIRYIPGVHDLLMSDGKPGMVPEAAVEALRAAEAAAGENAPGEAALAPGAVVAVSRGVLAGQQGMVVRVEKSRVWVALMMLGVLRELEFPPEGLAPVEWG